VWAIIDIDQTLADNSERAKIIDKPEPTEEDWREYDQPDLVAQDVPYPEAQEVFPKLVEQVEHVVFITGRMEDLREVTENWLLEHYAYDVAPEDLIMRANDDLSTSSEYKTKALEKLIADSGASYFIFVDDNSEVLEEFENYGIILRAPECWSVMKPV